MGAAGEGCAAAGFSASAGGSALAAGAGSAGAAGSVCLAYGAGDSSSSAAWSDLCASTEGSISSAAASFRRQIRNIEAVQAAQLDGHVFIDRAGVRLLFGDAQFREPVQDFVSLHFQLPRQLVDSNLLHRESNLLYNRPSGRFSHDPDPTSGFPSTSPETSAEFVSGRTCVFYRTRLFHSFIGFRFGLHRLRRSGLGHFFRRPLPLRRQALLRLLPRLPLQPPRPPPQLLHSRSSNWL